MSDNDKKKIIELEIDKSFQRYGEPILYYPRHLVFYQIFL